MSIKQSCSKKFTFFNRVTWMKIQKSEMKSASLLSIQMKIMQDYLRIEKKFEKKHYV